MRRAVPWALLFTFLFAASAEAALERSSKRECCLCHVLWTNAFSRADQTLLQNRESSIVIAGSVGVASSRQMCYSCHDGYVADSRAKIVRGNKHMLVGKVPDGLHLPEGFRLDKNNEFYCGTCHGFHDLRATGAIGQTPFVRMKNERSQMCIACHPDKTQAQKYKNHPVLKQPGGQRSLEDARARGVRLGPDGEIICQSCHAPHARKALVERVDDSRLCFFCHADKKNPGKLLDRGRPLHPVNVKPSAEMAGSVARYVEARPDSHLGTRGEIECLSCHSVHRGSGREMALQGGQGFCESCHGARNQEMAATKHNLRLTAPGWKNRRDESPGDAGICEACHLAHGWATPGVPRGDDVSQVCLACHNRRGVARKKTVGEYSHPIGRIPKNMKKDTPLRLVSAGGREGVGCVTCHDPHRYDPDPTRSIPPVDQDGDSGNSFLRLAGRDLCAQCHAERSSVQGTKHDLRLPDLKCTDEERRQVEQGGVCRGCHRVHHAGNAYLWARSPFPAADIGSQLCGSCHQQGQCAEKKKIFQFNHPLDVALAEGMKNDLPLYQNPGEEGARVVACFTCHDPHRWAAKGYEAEAGEPTEEGGPLNSFLRAPNDSGASLCVSCHARMSAVARTDHDMRFSEAESGDRKRLSKSSSVCAGCHAPHSDDPTKELWVEGLSGSGTRTAEACQGCHREGGRAAGKILKNGHPLSKSDEREDRLEVSRLVDGKVVATLETLTCSSCHDPHQWSSEPPAGNTPVLDAEGDGSTSFLKTPTLPEAQLCLGCHQEKTSILNTKHDMRRYGNPKDPSVEAIQKRVREEGLCSACHRVHNAEQEEYLWAFDLSSGHDRAEGMCFACHAEEKVPKAEMPHRYRHPDVLLKLRLQEAKIPSKLIDTLTQCLVYDDVDSVNCLVCHDPHRWEAGTESPWNKEDFEASAENRFLRARSEDQVCRVCHGLEGIYRYLFFHQWDRISQKP